MHKYELLTLDKVIDNLQFKLDAEFCCKLHSDGHILLLVSTLNYLKEYKQLKKKLGKGTKK